MTKIKLPELTEALIEVRKPSLRDITEAASISLRYARSFAKVYLDLDEISLEDLLKLADYINGLLPNDELDEPPDGVDPDVPSDIAANDLFFAMPMCEDPACDIHHMQDHGKLRRTLLLIVRSQQSKLNSKYYEHAVRLLEDPTTTFKIYAAGVRVVASATFDKDKTGMN